MIWLIFLGYVELILLVVSILIAWPSAVGRFLIAAAAVTFVLALGRQDFIPWAWPYPYLFQVTPFRGVIEPARLYVIVYLAATLLILMALQRIRDRRVLAVVVVLLAVERVPWRIPTSDTLADPELVAAVQARPTNAVLDLPANTSWRMGNRYDMYSVHYDRPIVNGYLHWSGDYQWSRSVVDGQLAPYSCHYDAAGPIRQFDPAAAPDSTARLIGWMEEQDVRTIVVRWDYLANRRECGAAEDYIAALFLDGDRWAVLMDAPGATVRWLKPGS